MFMHVPNCCDSLKVKVKSLNRVRLIVTPWTAAYQLLCPWDFPGKSTGVGCRDPLVSFNIEHFLSTVCLS